MEGYCITKDTDHSDKINISYKGKDNISDNNNSSNIKVT